MKWVAWLKDPANSPLRSAQVYKLIAVYELREGLDAALDWFAGLNTVPPSLAAHKGRTGFTLDKVHAILVAHHRFKTGRLDLDATSGDAAAKPARITVRQQLEVERSTVTALRSELAAVIGLYEEASGQTYMSPLPAAEPAALNGDAGDHRDDNPEIATVGKYSWTPVMLDFLRNQNGGIGKTAELTSMMQGSFGREFSAAEVEWAKKRLRAERAAAKEA